jgi:hypothetical protein
MDFLSENPANVVRVLVAYGACTVMLIAYARWRRTPPEKRPAQILGGPPILVFRIAVAVLTGTTVLIFYAALSDLG